MNIFLQGFLFPVFFGYFPWHELFPVFPNLTITFLMFRIIQLVGNICANSLFAFRANCSIMTQPLYTVSSSRYGPVPFWVVVKTACRRSRSASSKQTHLAWTQQRRDLARKLTTKDTQRVPKKYHDWLIPQSPPSFDSSVTIYKGRCIKYPHSAH